MNCRFLGHFKPCLSECCERRMWEKFFMEGNFPLFRILFETVKPCFGVDNRLMSDVSEDGPYFWPVPDSGEMSRLTCLYRPVSPIIPEKQAGYDDELPF